MAGKIKKAKTTNKMKEEEIQIEAKLPNGISLTNVSGIDIPTEETGNVLQFLEFCSAFGKVLDYWLINLSYVIIPCVAYSLNLCFILDFSDRLSI